MFCAPRLVFGGTGGVAPRFHVMRSRTRFRGYRMRRGPFSCFARPDSFSAVTWASGPVFMFYAPGLLFGGTEDVGCRFWGYPPKTRTSGTEGVGSRFQVLRSRTPFRRYRGRRVPFSCSALPDLFPAGTVGVGSRFHVLRSRTRFRRYRERRVLFSCFALPYSFSTVPRAPRPVFILCAPGLVFGGTECVGVRYNVLCSRTHFRR
jgi:hypothetical protein